MGRVRRVEIILVRVDWKNTTPKYLYFVFIWIVLGIGENASNKSTFDTTARLQLYNILIGPRYPTITGPYLIRWQMLPPRDVIGAWRTLGNPSIARWRQSIY